MIMEDSSSFRHYGIELELAAFQSPRLMAALPRTAGLSIGSTRRSGSRSFHVSHVAGVVTIGIRECWSYDAKQFTTARELGLDVNPRIDMRCSDGGEFQDRLSLVHESQPLSRRSPLSSAYQRFPV
jgi:hypothetical protein